MNITRKEACELITSHIGMPVNEIMDEAQKRMIFAVNNDIQVRDFFMGLPVNHDIKDVIKLSAFLAGMAKQGEDVPFFTLTGMFAYEMGNDKLCKLSLNYAEKNNPSYSLTQLLKRVIMSGWPKESFVTMRTELHPKIIQHCYTEEPDFVITMEETNA
jgi:hypothetical protein